MTFIIDFFGYLILLYFSFLWATYTLLLIFSFNRILRKFKEAKYNSIYPFINQKVSFPVSIFVPIYNEAHRMHHTISSILKSQYPNVHLIIVNDGSTDETLQKLKEQYLLYPLPPAFKKTLKTSKIIQYYGSQTIKNMLVIDKKHGPANSGADALNAALNACKTPFFITIDADTLLEPETITHFLFTYLTNPHCISIGGALYLSQGCILRDGEVIDVHMPKNFTAGTQIIEYLRSFLYGRESSYLLGGSLCFPGALTFFETQAVREFGGYDTTNFSYDAEITIKLHHMMRKHHYPYRIVFDQNAQGWTEQPNTLKGLWNQRNKWQRGLLRSLCIHKGMFFNPRYGVIGLVGFPEYISLEIFGPVVEALSYIYLILVFFFLSPSALIELWWFILLAWGFSMITGITALFLEFSTHKKYNYLDTVYILVLATIDFFGYRQVRAFSSLFATFQYLINRLLGRPQ